MLHPTAIISDDATIGDDVEVGAYTVIDGPVTISAGCSIGPHCHLIGPMTIGRNTSVHAGAILGDTPQDFEFRGESGGTELGEDCIIREYATVHRGSSADRTTTIGKGTMLMVFSHVGHDCRIGEQVVVSNSTLLGGHVHIHDRAILSANVAVHQFVHIGTGAMITGQCRISRDVPPWALVGVGNVIFGHNAVGLKRARIPKDTARALKFAIRTLIFGELTVEDALSTITKEHGDLQEIKDFTDFVRNCRRGITPGVPRRWNRNSAGASEAAGTSDTPKG